MTLAVAACSAHEATQAGTAASDAATESADAGAAVAADDGWNGTFESVGGFACQSAAPGQALASRACNEGTLPCDASLTGTLAQALEGCSFILNENSVEFFFSDGCAVGIVEGRDDPQHITDAARRCMEEKVGRLRVGCPRPVCVRVEHSTLAAP